MVCIMENSIMLTFNNSIVVKDLDLEIYIAYFMDMNYFWI